MSIVEEIEIIDGGIIKFIPNTCEHCCNFTGTSTCKINTERYYYPDKTINVEVLRFLDRESPSEDRFCKIKNQHRGTKVIDMGQPLKGGGSKFELAVLQYMKKNCRESKDLTVNDRSFKEVIHSINLFKEGDVETLISLYPYILTNATNNSYYSKPFEYFTGIRFNGLGCTMGNKKKENKTFEFVRDMCKHRKVLNRMVNAYIKYAPNDRHPDNFTYNFQNFFTELLFGKNVQDFYLHGRITRFSTINARWGYILNYREALREAGDFTEEQLPSFISIDYKKSDKKSKELQRVYSDKNSKVQNDFVDWAHQKLSSEAVSN